MDQNDFFTVCRVDVDTQTYHKEPFPDSWVFLGGRVMLERMPLEPSPPHNPVFDLPGKGLD
jgi:hypothetical protein